VVDAHVPHVIGYIALTMSTVHLMEECYGTGPAMRLGDHLRQAFTQAGKAAI
jgi:hypothetical protein